MPPCPGRSTRRRVPRSRHASARATVCSHVLPRFADPRDASVPPMGALQDRNKELIRRWIGPADDGDGPFLLSDAALELLAEDAVWHLPPTAEIPGLEDPRVVRGRDDIHAIQMRADEIYDVPT